MKFDAKELRDVIATTKVFMSQDVVDEKLKYVSFYEDYIIARNSFAGLVYLHDFKIEEPFGVPFDVFSKLNTLISGNTEVDVKITPARVVWKMGGYRYQSGKVDVGDFEPIIPEEEDWNPLPETFYKSLEEAEFVASKDARQQKLYGIYIDDGKILSSDNRRVYMQKVKQLKKVEDLFISRELLTILAKLPGVPSAFARTETLLLFEYEDFLVFAAVLGFNYPKLDRVYAQTENETRTGNMLISNKGRTRIEDALPLLRDKFNGKAEVRVGEKRMFISINAVAVGSVEKFEISIPVKYDGDEEVEFKINSLFLAEALLRFDEVQIFSPRFIYCKNETEKHIVMLVV